jgi:hypothetical protein
MIGFEIAQWRGWGFSSVEERLPGKCKDLSSAPALEKKRKKEIAQWSITWCSPESVNSAVPEEKCYSILHFKVPQGGRMGSTVQLKYISP